MIQKSSNEIHDPPFIVGIEVDELFGYYTYRLGMTSKIDRPSSSQILLLYGDNGTGKTTIAQLIFHLLSLGELRGHRTFLAKTKFRRFALRFNNGSVITANRIDHEHLIGPYSISVELPNKKTNSVEVSTSEDGSVKHGDVDDDKLKEILHSISDPSITVYFLSDNRVLQSDSFDDEIFEHEYYRKRITTRRSGEIIERLIEPSLTRDLTVTPSVERVQSWLRQQAIHASSAGEATMSNIYIDIIKRISKSTISAEPKKEQTLDDLLSNLNKLSNRAEEFTSLGLSRPIPFKELESIIESANTDRQGSLASVLEPYVDSIKSRLDAYQELKEKLSVFLDIINSFYKGKCVRITLSKGIQIFDEQGIHLDMDLLSSGEKQILLLLCNILVATTQSSLFIIDEPELSLNVKWQRQLVDSLLELCRGSHVQFIMATHSIELLTKHKDHVLKLDHLAKTEK